MKKPMIGAMAALFSLLAAGCGGDKQEQAGKRSYAFVTNGVATFWDIVKAGAEAAGQDLGQEVTVLMPKGAVEQKQMLEDLVIRGVDGVAVSPIDADNQVEVINKVAAATKLITADSDAPKANRILYLGTDNYEAGRMCGELVKKALPDGGSVMIFIGRLEQDNAKARRQGLIDELAGRSRDASRYDPPGQEPKDGKYPILGTLTDEFDQMRGKQNVDDTLTAHPDLGCAVGLFVFNPPLILESLRGAGRLGQVKVVGFDEAEETLRGIADGHVQGTVVQNPYDYGYRSIEVLDALARGDESVIPERGFINIPPRVIDKENVAAFREDLHLKLGN